jgi:hypothetical protein
MPQAEQEVTVAYPEPRPHVSYLDRLREDPEKLAAHLERVGLPRSLASGTNAEIRGAVIQQMIRDSAGRTLDLNGMTVREYSI